MPLLQKTKWQANWLKRFSLNNLHLIAEKFKILRGTNYKTENIKRFDYPNLHFKTPSTILNNDMLAEVDINSHCDGHLNAANVFDNAAQIIPREISHSFPFWRSNYRLCWNDTGSFHPSAQGCRRQLQLSSGGGGWRGKWGEGGLTTWTSCPFYCRATQTQTTTPTSDCRQIAQRNCQNKFWTSALMGL